MISKQVTDREKSVAFVAAAIDTHQEAIDAQISLMLSRYLRPGETMPNTRLLLDLIKRCIQDNNTQLVDADRLLATERSEDSALRDARDALVNEARELVDDLLTIVTVTFGAHIANTFGLDKIPTDPTALTELLQRTSSALLAFDWPAPRRANQTFDAKTWAADLISAAKGLKANTTALATDLRQTDKALSQRNLQQSVNDASFIHGAGVVESFCRFADTPKLLHVADRIRPSKRRPGQTNDLAEGLTPPPEPTDETNEIPVTEPSPTPET